jgi:hypothetical protein
MIALIWPLILPHSDPNTIFLHEILHFPLIPSQFISSCALSLAGLHSAVTMSICWLITYLYLVASNSVVKALHVSSTRRLKDLTIQHNKNKSKSLRNPMVEQMMFESIKMRAFRESFVQYKEIEVLNKLANQMGYVIFPATLGLIVIGVGSVCFWLSVKMPGRIPSALYLLMPLNEIAVFITGTAMFPEFANVFELSDDYLNFWEREIGSGRFRRMLRSCARLRLNVGPFFFFNKASKLAIFAKTIEYGIQLTISIHVPDLQL